MENTVDMSEVVSGIPQLVDTTIIQACQLTATVLDKILDGFVKDIHPHLAEATVALPTNSTSVSGRKFHAGGRSPQPVRLRALLSGKDSIQRRRGEADDCSEDTYEDILLMVMGGDYGFLGNWCCRHRVRPQEPLDLIPLLVLALKARSRIVGIAAGKKFPPLSRALRKFGHGLESIAVTIDSPIQCSP